MRKEDKRHYFKSEEITVLETISNDIIVTIEANKLNEIPHERAKQWAAYLKLLFLKHKKR